MISSFVSPLLYVWRWACCSAASSRVTPTSSRARRPTSPSSCPGLIAAHAMQTAVGETTYPVMGMIKWQQDLRLDDRDAAAGAATSSPPTCASCCSGWRPRARCSCWCSRRSASSRRWWGPLVAFAPGPGRHGLRGLDLRLHATRIRSEAAFGVLFRLGVFPMFLFSGAFFPIANLGDVGEWVARLTPLWHGVNLSRMFALDRSTLVDWRRSTSATGGARGRRLVVVGRRPREAARRMTRRSAPRPTPGSSRWRRSRRCGCSSSATTSSTAQAGSCS